MQFVSGRRTGSRSADELVVKMAEKGETSGGAAKRGAEKASSQAAGSAKELEGERGRDAARPSRHQAGVEGKETAEGVRPAPAPKAAKPLRSTKKKPGVKPTRPKLEGKTDIGIGVKPPGRACEDRDCPFHGRLPVRGQIFEGVVVSDGMDKSAVIRRERLVYVPKYERYMKRTSRMSVHNPPCIGAKVGDEVTVMECRPLSKTISFTIVSKKGV